MEMWDHFFTSLHALFTGAPLYQSPHFLGQNTLWPYFTASRRLHTAAACTPCMATGGWNQLLIQTECFFIAMWACPCSLNFSPSTSVVF